MPSQDLPSSLAEQSDGHQAADQPLSPLETLLAAAGSSVAFCCLVFDHMGTTFVTIHEGCTGTEPGFWMRDEMLELWLRLLALHLPEPTDNGEHTATFEIRNRWLLASRFYFGGCTPHHMEDACSTPEGRAVVRYAIDSLMTTLLESQNFRLTP
jgi:hypothetical protein